MNTFLFLICLLCPFCIFAKSNTLQLECQTVPLKQVEVCTLSTQAEHFPVNDLVLYKREESGELVFLDAIKGDVAISWFWGFSNEGKYAVISFAEEGHPYFVFFETNGFLQSEKRPKAEAIISDYFLGQLMEVQDNGIAIFAWADTRQMTSEQSDCLNDDIHHNFVDDSCYVSINIYENDTPSVE